MECGSTLGGPLTFQNRGQNRATRMESRGGIGRDHGEARTEAPTNPNNPLICRWFPWIKNASYCPTSVCAALRRLARPQGPWTLEGHAAVHQMRLPGDVARLVGGEE